MSKDITYKEAKVMFEIIRNTPSVLIFNKLPDDSQGSDNVLGINWQDLLDTAIAALRKCEENDNETDNQSSRIAHNVYDGYICNYGVEYPNHYMIMPEALKISDNMQVPIAYTSDTSLPEFIGSAELESDSCGILAHCQFSDNYASLVDLLKSGKYDLGFTAIDVKYTTDDNGVRYYTQGTIRNISILPYPYNPRIKPTTESNEECNTDD